MRTNERFVAVLVDGSVLLFENGEQVGTCTEKCSNTYSLVVEGSKVWFSNTKKALVEFDSESLESRLRLPEDVFALSGVPGKENFLAISRDGLLQTLQAKKQLKDVFPKMKDCYWTAVVSLGSHSVVAGYSKFSIVNGSSQKKEQKIFLLVRLPDLEVVNQKNPPGIAWVGSTSLV